MPSAPHPKKIPQRRTLHGITSDDPYHWLRDDNWQRVMREPETLAPEIRAHLEQENEHTASVLSPTLELQKRLFEELKGRIKEDESSVPAKDGAYEYYVRYEIGSQHPRHCRRPSRGVTTGLVSKGPSPDEQVLFDADAASKAHTYFSPGAVVHSKDHRLLGYAVDTKGSEYYEIRFRDLNTGDELEDQITSTSGSLVLSSDGATVFYTRVDDNHRPSKVFRHRIGEPAERDVLVYEELDPGFFVGVEVTEDYRYIVITAHDHVTSEQRLIDAQRPNEAPRLIAPRTAGLEYSVSALGDELLLLTNAGALDFKLAVAPGSDPRPESWRDLVPHRPGRLIVAATTFSGHIVRLEREDGLPRIVIRSREDGSEHVIAFAEAAYSLGL
jgi:oligopeptidase B